MNSQQYEKYEKEKLYSPQDIARALNVSLSYVYKLLKIAQEYYDVKIIKIGRLTRLDEKEFQKFITAIQKIREVESKKEDKGRTR